MFDGISSDAAKSSVKGIEIVLEFSVGGLS
jgi:hypothetical protein